MFDPHTAYNQTEALIDQEKFDEALQELLKIVEQDDSFVLAHLALAKVYTKLGEHVKAVEHSKKACEIEPEEPFNFTAMSVTCQRAWAGTQDKAYIQMAEEAMAQAHALNGR
jgi:tetratricopeptide (TPR) repeat protein